MMKKQKIKMPKIVTIIGSTTKFMKELNDAASKYTLNGYLVFHPIIPSNIIGPNIKNDIDKLCLRQIDMSDEVYVVNKDGYIGDSTRREIGYAFLQNKELKFLEENTQYSSKDEENGKLF